MRYASVFVFAVVLALAAVAAFAQAGGCPTLTCPSATIPSQSGACLGVPAGLGAGPLPCLQGACGADFDRAFITSMYQQSSDIAALATQGIQQASDTDLKDLSGKIRYEQTKQNEKYTYWAQQMGYGTLSVDYGRIQNVVSPLAGLTGQAFDVEYANRMIGLLSQQRDAATLALSQATNPDMRNQAQIIVRADTNEINALQRWLGSRLSVPAAVGAGPCGTVCPPVTAPVCPPACAPAAPTCVPSCGAGPAIVAPVAPIAPVAPVAPPAGTTTAPSDSGNTY